MGGRRGGVALLQLGDVFGGGNAADDSVCAIGEGSLVDDGIVDVWLDAITLAPVLRKNMMNIDVLTEEDRMVELLTRSKVLRAHFHQQGVDTFVGRRQSHTHGL